MVEIETTDEFDGWLRSLRDKKAASIIFNRLDHIQRAISEALRLSVRA